MLVTEVSMIPMLSSQKYNFLNYTDSENSNNGTQDPLEI